MGGESPATAVANRALLGKISGYSGREKTREKGVGGPWHGGGEELALGVPFLIMCIETNCALYRLK
jgi:hypothetical protein